MIMKLFLLNVAIVIFGIFSIGCTKKTDAITEGEQYYSVRIGGTFTLKTAAYSYANTVRDDEPYNITGNGVLIHPTEGNITSVASHSITYKASETPGVDTFTVEYATCIDTGTGGCVPDQWYQLPVKITIFDDNNLSTDVNNTPISNYANATDILDFPTPKIPNIDTYIYGITTLPSPDQGTLYIGYREVTEPLWLNSHDVADLRFDPNPDNTEDVTFTYTVASVQPEYSSNHYYYDYYGDYDDNNFSYLNDDNIKDKYINTDSYNKYEIADDDTPATFTIPINGLPKVTIHDANATEGEDLVFKINLSSPSNEPIAITVNTQNGTAKDGEDYYGMVNDLYSIPVGVTDYNLTIKSVSSDDTYEGDETFSVKVQVSLDATINIELNAKGKIIDTDAPPTVTINDASATEGESMVFVIKLSHLSSFGTVIDLNTSDDTAKKDIDFTFIDDSVLIPAGDTNKTVTVDTTYDSDIEGEELFTLNGTVLSENTENIEVHATGTIIDAVPNIAPETVNINNQTPISIKDRLVDIDDLQGYDTDGSVTGYRITTLPDPLQGTLYVSDGTTPVILNQVLSLTEAAGLKFDPQVQYDSPASAFTYAAIDDRGAEDSTDAIFVMPLYDPTTPLIPPSGQDNDSDGFLTPDDCDDTNPSVNPAMLEIPLNGIDDNCNGQIDEGGTIPF